MVRVAVVGVNRIGRPHCQVYTRLPGAELVAVCDLLEKWWKRPLSPIGVGARSWTSPSAPYGGGMMMRGHRTWLIPDGFLPPKSSGEQISHEAVCVLNTTHRAATIRLTLYFEDREPMDAFVSSCGARRTHHIRLDQLRDVYGAEVPRGVPYAISVESDIPVVVQHSRLDTSQVALALFTTMAFPSD